MRLLSKIFIRKKRRMEQASCFSVVEAEDTLWQKQLHSDYIYISPPDVTIETDEDIPKDRHGQPVEDTRIDYDEWDFEKMTSVAPRIEALPHAHIRSEAEIAVPNGPRLKNKEEVEGWIRNKRPPVVPRSHRTEASFDNCFPESNYEDYEDLSSVQFFELFLDNKVVLHLITQTEKYARFKGYAALNLCVDEFKCFLAVLLFSALSRIPPYGWSNASEVMQVHILGMERFEEIMRAFHCADNTQLDVNDKFCKIRPFADLIRQNFLKHFQPSCRLSFNDCLIGYFGKHRCFHRRGREKPRTIIDGFGLMSEVCTPYSHPMSGFGFSAWCLNQEDGYLVNFELDQFSKDVGSSDMSRAASALKNLVEELPPRMRKSSFVMQYHNRYFARDFEEQAESILVSNETSKEDNQVVEKKRKSVALFFHYKKMKGPAIVMNNSMHRIGVRTNKWWSPIVMWLIDVCVHNAFMMVKKSGNIRNLTRQQLIAEVAMSYIDRWSARKRKMEAEE